MAAASDLLVPEGFVLGFLPIASVPFVTFFLGFVEIYGRSSSGTGASSGRASSGVSSHYPLIPAPFSCATTIGVHFGEMSEESEESDPDAEWSSEWSWEQLSGEVESEEQMVTGSSGEDEELAEQAASMMSIFETLLDDSRTDLCVRDVAPTSCWCERCAEAWRLQRWRGRCVEMQSISDALYDSRWSDSWTGVCVRDWAPTSCWCERCAEAWRLHTTM
jgi:hypothetical protein